MINIEELRSALTKSHKWKSPGVGKIPNFLLNCPTSTHKQMALNFTNILQNPETAPEWLTEGTTYLLSKNQENSKPQTLLTNHMLGNHLQDFNINYNRTYVHIFRGKLDPSSRAERMQVKFLRMQRSALH